MHKVIFEKRSCLVAFKYLWKFVNGTMTSKELNIIESVADLFKEERLSLLEPNIT